LALPIPPHAIVETSQGNHHAYWLVDGCHVEQFKPLQQALAKQLGTDPNVCDANRAMRLPGTINWKHDKPFLAKLVRLQEDAKPIPVDRFIKKMELQLVTREINKSATDSVTVTSSANQFTPALRRKVAVALEGLAADDRWCWLRVGMALHSVDSGEAGYDIWTAWSRNSAKFDEKDQRRNWDSFKPNGGINIHTLFWIANHVKAGGAMVFDEMSLARMFEETTAQRLRYDRDSKKWYYFNDVVWVEDAQAPMRLVLGLIEELNLGEKGGTTDSLKRFRSAAGFRGIVHNAELREGLHISPQEFDKHSNLLAVKNGVVDLATGTFRAATADDYLRRQANVIFDAQASCPHWIRFMRSVTCEDRALYAFIRRALGYTLIGQANLQLFFVAIGSGGNGKGVLMRTVQKVLGDYAQSVAPNLLTSAYSGNVNGPTPALARLCGARMVVCTELPSGRRLDDAFVKQYAGGDEITARPTYGNVFSFKPEGKLWLSTNEMPEIPATDEAMWRRLKPIPFKAKFRGNAVDDTLEEKFKSEYPGILNWLLKGAKEFTAEGLGSCDAVEELEAQMRKASDSVHAWMVECCVKQNGEAVQAALAYDSYTNFTRRSRRKPLSPSIFRFSLEDKGF
jgi:putative DNA primase/helicase